MTTVSASRWPLYLQLMRFDRPIGIWLLLWPTLWALWMAAEGVPPLPVLAVFVLGTVLMRAAGCIVNDLADRDFDPHVARTRGRPLASGQVSPREALRLFIAVSLLAFALAGSLHNGRVLLLAVPAVLLAVVYPFCKRWISIPQAVLGLAFSWGIPMGYAAVRAQIPWLDVLALMTANLAWVIAYDTFYAMSDREDDLRIGVRSSAILFGRADRAITAVLQLLSLLLLAWVGRRLGPAYAVGLAVAAACAAYEQWLIRDRDPARCFTAFLHSNWYGLAVFGGLALDRLLAAG
jgi:4-hydroxybenzoate polyprenyltransferase